MKNDPTVSQGINITRTLSTERKYVETTEKDGIRTIRLSDSASRNSLSLEMLKILLKEIKRDEDNKDLRSILLISDSGKVFSAGHNLKELTATNAKFHKDVFETCAELMRTISQSPVPVIAAVDGLAAAAGCQLVAACDIAVCTERSSFSTPGYFANSLSHYLLSFWPLSLILDEEVHRIIDAINAKSRSVIHLGKTFLYEQMDLDISTAYFLGTRLLLLTAI